jgi:acyl carrier protein
MDVLQSLKEFLSTETAAGADILSVDNDEDLLARGVIDSMTLLKLVTFLEETFGIRVLDEDINKRNFRDLNAMKRFVDGKLGAAGA